MSQVHIKLQHWIEATRFKANAAQQTINLLYRVHFEPVSTMPWPGTVHHEITTAFPGILGSVGLTAGLIEELWLREVFWFMQC